MADVTPVRLNIPLPGTQFLGAVSEFIAQSISGSTNFINYFQHSEKQFFLNGSYNIGQTLPQQALDGLAVFEFNAQIIDVWMFNLVNGSSATTEIDIQISQTSASANGGSGTAFGSWTSIFTTKPSIAFNSTAPAWVGAAVNTSVVGPLYSPSPSYSAPSNTVAPVLNASVTNSIPRWTAIRCDLTALQGGTPQNCGIVIHYRPI